MPPAHAQTGYFNANLMPAPSGVGVPSTSIYPFTWVLMADVGQTYNSSMTAQYIQRYDTINAGTGGVDVILNAADLTYSDNYGPTSNNLPNPGVAGTNQQRWDTWSTMWQGVLGTNLIMHAAGNHELDSQVGHALTYKDGPSTYGYAALNAAGQPNAPFQSWTTRHPNGALPIGKMGDIWSSSWYSQNLGPVHLVVLNNYLPFHQGTAQYNFFVADMAAVNRTQTPWLIVSFHAPPYHSYYTHYKEMECFMSVYEPLFYQARVDFVINGHVHAYERTHPMYNYAKDSCGPVYLTMGDGGNVEGPYRNFVDDLVPGSNVTYCQAAWTAAITSNPYYAPSPSYQTQVHPPGCVITSYQQSNGKAGGLGVVPNPTLDPSSSAYFCQSSQPTWSAYRDPSFGFAGMNFTSDTTATFSWFRNIDQNPSGSTLTSVDSTTFTKYTGACQGNTPALQSVSTTLFSPAPATFTGTPYNGSSATYKWGSNATMLVNTSTLTAKNPITGGAIAANASNPQWRAGDAFVAYPTGFSAGVQSGDPLPGQIMLWTRFQPSNDQSAKAAADPSNIAYTYNYAPAPGTIPINVSWWLSATNSSNSALASGVYTTDGSRDWTVKLDVNYGMVPQQMTLFYGFSATDTATGVAYSTTGSFRALANTNLAQLNYAVVSCSNWGFGYFNVYNMMSQLDALDLWVHVGDNIYEYKDLNYPGPDTKVRPFVTDPPNEIVTLDDYRRRYRLYRLDPDLQALGAKVAFISLTDDHDYVNNAWMTYAENHQPTGVSSTSGAGFDMTPYPEGDYYARIGAALSAYMSYMPIREGTAVYSGTSNTGSAATDLAAVTAAANAAYPATYFSNGALTAAYTNAAQVQAVPGSAAPNVTALMRWQMAKQQRAFTFPGLMTLALTEDRVAYRTSGNAVDQNGYTSVPGPTGEGPVKTALGGLLYSYGTNPASWPAAAVTGLTSAYAYEKTLSGGYYNCTGDTVDGPNCFGSLSNVQQHVIGNQAINFLASTFAASKANSIPFQVWTSQTCFFPSAFPDTYSAASPAGNNSQATAAGYTPRATSAQFAGSALTTGSYPALGLAKVGWNTDSWDGFQAERQMVMNALASSGSNVIINSGDAHTFWASKVASGGPTAQPNMAEWCGGSVTSPGWAEAFGAAVAGQAVSPMQNYQQQLLEDGFMISDAPNLVASRMAHGALVFRVTPTAYTGQMFTINNMATRTYHASCDNAFVIPAGQPGNMMATKCVNTLNGSVPGTFLPAPTPPSPPMPPPPLPPPPNPPSPTPPLPPPPNPPSPTPPTVASVSASISLQGITQTQWTSNPSIQAVFVSTLATQLGSALPGGQAYAITVTSATSSRRHLLQGGTTVAFTIAAPTSASALSLTAAINAVSTTGAATFVAALNTNLVTASITGVSCTGVVLVSAPTVPGVTFPVYATPSNSADKKVALGVGLGLGLGLGLPIVCCIAVVFLLPNAKPAGKEVDPAAAAPGPVDAVAIPAVVAEAPAAV